MPERFETSAHSWAARTGRRCTRKRRSKPGCEHKRTEFLMRRDGIDYLRCVECDQVFEAEDLEQIPVYDDEEEEQPRRKKAS